MEYRLNKESLLDILSAWNGFLKRTVHLIACGGTALTLQGIKPSTRDVDFIVPKEEEYKYLINNLKQLGYEQTTGAGWARKGELWVFDLYQGKRIHTTELLGSPLETKNHTRLKEFSHLYIGVLNDYDLMLSKLFRGAAVDFEDCLALLRIRKKKFDCNVFVKRYKETAQFDVSEERILKNLEHFKHLATKEGLWST